MLLKTIFYQKDTGLLEEMTNSTSRSRKLKMSLVFQKVKKYLNNDGNLSKGHRNQLEEASTGKIWGNLSIKINNVRSGRAARLIRCEQGSVKRCGGWGLVTKEKNTIFELALWYLGVLKGQRS